MNVNTLDPNCHMMALELVRFFKICFHFWVFVWRLIQSQETKTKGPFLNKLALGDSFASIQSVIAWHKCVQTHIWNGNCNSEMHILLFILISCKQKIQICMRIYKLNDFAKRKVYNKHCWDWSFECSMLPINCI